MILPTILLIGTILLAVGFTLFRVAESKREERFFNESRTLLDSYATELWTALVTGGLPVRWRQNAVVVMHHTTHTGVTLAVSALRAVERPLARLSYKMRVSAPKAGNTQVSEFLKTLAPDKGTSQNSPSTV